MSTFRNKYIEAFNTYFGIGLTSHVSCPMDKFLRASFPKTLWIVEGKVEKVIQEYVDFTIELPTCTPEDCVAKGVTYEAKCRIQLSQTDYDNNGEIIKKDNISLQLSPIQLVNQRGNFVVSGKSLDLQSQIKNSVGVTVRDAENLYIKDVNSRKLHFHKNTDSSFLICINGRKLNSITVLRYLLAHDNPAWKGTDQELLESMQLADVVSVNEKDLLQNIGSTLAYPVSYDWVEDIVDESTGDIVSIQRSRQMFARGTSLNEDVIDRLLATKKNCGKKVYLEFRGDSFGKALLTSLYKDSTSNKHEAFSYVYKQIFDKEPVGGWRNKAARKALNDVLMPEIGLIGRASINQILGYEYDGEETDFVANSCVLTMGSEFLSVRDYINVFRALLSENHIGFDKKGRDLPIFESERNKALEDYQRVFSTFIVKELCRFELPWNDYCMGFITHRGLINALRPFSIAESLLYTHLPLAYVTDTDESVCRYYDDAIYNFSGEKFICLY